MDQTPIRPGGRRRPIVAAAIVAGVLVAGWTGVAAAGGNHGGDHGAGHRHGFGLSGMVASVDDATRSFTVTKHSGRTVTVGTTAATTYVDTVDATVADAVAGTFVMAKGGWEDAQQADDHQGDDNQADDVKADNGALAADRLSIVQTSGEHKGRVGDEFVAGTVLGNAATATGRILAIDVDGDSTPDQSVTTTDATKVTRTFDTTFSDVDVNDLVTVKGWRTGPGSFTALRVALHGTGSPATPEATTTTSSSTSTSSTSTTSTTKPSTTTTTAPQPKVTPVATEPAAARGVIASVGNAVFTLTKHDETITVHTAAGTTYLKTVDATLADVAGQQVTVKAVSHEGDTVVAGAIRIHATASEDRHDGFCDDGVEGVSGVASNVDTNAGTFTVAGHTVMVNADTVITNTIPGSFADLAVGKTAKVFGTRQADGSIAAAIVHVDLSTHHAGGFTHTGTWDGSHDGTWDGDHHDDPATTSTTTAPTSSTTWGGHDDGGHTWHR